MSGRAAAGAPEERAVVLVPAYGAVDPGCEAGLRALETLGYEVRKLHGHASLDIARSRMASEALADGFDVLVWIDADMRFDAADVDRLRAHGLPFVAAVAAKKGKRELACHVLPGTKELVFGKRGGLVPLRYIGCAFVVTRRVLYEKMRAELDMPTCNVQFGESIVPFFIPTVVDDAGGPWYVEGDYAFCERARAVGIEIMADTRVRVLHVGPYAYGWEEASREIERFGDFTVTLVESARKK